MRTLKVLTFLIIPILCSLFCSGQEIKNDTLFLLRQYSADDFHIIYIDNNKTSKEYGLIADFDFNRQDSINYLYWIEYLKKNNKNPFKKHTVTDIPKKWCPLYIYKSKFYLLTPTDFGGNLGCVEITDSTWIVYGGEGPTPGRINSFQKTDNNTYNINITPYDSFQYDLKISIIDKEKGIALFGKVLMISADKIKLFPIIVDNSGTKQIYPEGMHPIKFEEPNKERLKKLLIKSE